MINIKQIRPYGKHLGIDKVPTTINCMQYNIPLIRPLPPMATPLIRPHFRTIEIVKYFHMRDHPSYMTTFSMQQERLYKRDLLYSWTGVLMSK